MIPDVFHGFSKDRSVHQLEKLFLRFILGVCVQLCVKLNVFLQPRLFFEAYSSMNLFDSEIEILFQCSVTKYVFLSSFRFLISFSTLLVINLSGASGKLLCKS